MGTDLTSFTCFDECYFGKSPGATSLPYSTTEDNCNESKNPFYAITCTGKFDDFHLESFKLFATLIFQTSLTEDVFLIIFIFSTENF